MNLTRSDIERLPNFRRKTRSEYSASCPVCPGGGLDRFLFWPDDGGYWCRQCGLQGWVGSDDGKGPDWQRIALAEAARRATAERSAAAALAEVAKLAPVVARYHANLLDPEKRAIWYKWGLTDETIDEHRLGYCVACPTWRQSDSLTIPVYHRGKLVSIRHRLLNPPTPGDKYRPQFKGLPGALYNADTLNDLVDCVLLVEGEIKAMVLEQYGFRAIGVAGIEMFKKHRSEWLPLFANAVSVVVIFDPKADSKAEEVAAVLREVTHTNCLILDCKPDDWFVVHQRSAEAFRQLVEDALKSQSPAVKAADVYAQLEAIGEEEKARGDGDVYTLLEREAEDDDPRLWAAANRRKRLAMCGLWFYKPDPRTRRGRWVPYSCGLPECAGCARKRVERIKRRIVEAAEGSPVYSKTVLASEDRGLSHQLNKESVAYSRHPREDGSVKFILVGQQVEGSEPLDLASMSDADWEDLARTPRGKNVSGSLMKHATPKPKADSSEEREVAFEMVHIKDEPQEVTEEVWEQAVLKTADLQPTLNTLEDDLKATVRAFRSIATQAGYATFSVYQKERVCANELNWKPYSESIRKKWQARQAAVPPKPPIACAVGSEAPT